MSEGTEAEIELCLKHGKAVIAAPPPMWPDTEVADDVDKEALRWYIRIGVHTREVRS